MSDDGTRDQPPPPFRDMAALLRGTYKFLGYSKSVIDMEATDGQVYGKWCRRCNGMWFGLLLEVECPRCGNRRG